MARGKYGWVTVKVARWVAGWIRVVVLLAVYLWWLCNGSKNMIKKGSGTGWTKKLAGWWSRTVPLAQIPGYV